MARYYSNHEISNFDKQLNEDKLFNTNKYKKELKDALNKENHRVNIDSAKKKAVMQRMDYDGFHQMVLGADIKGIKPNEIININTNSSIMNNIINQQKFGLEKDVFAKNFIPDIEKVLDKEGLVDGMNGLRIEDNKTKDLKVFTKQWKAKGNVYEKIDLLLSLNELNVLENMLDNGVLQSDLFLDVIYTIGTYILDKNADEVRLNFLIGSLDVITKNKQFNNLKKFLGKKHKTLYKGIQDVKDSIFEKDKNSLEIVDKILLYLI